MMWNGDDRSKGKGGTAAASRKAWFWLNFRDRRSVDESGYTLIEALVVLMILAFAVGMLAPQLTTIGGFNERRLSAGLFSDIQALRDDAVRRGVTTALRLQDGFYMLEPEQLRRVIPADAILKLEIGNPLNMNDSDERLWFFPDGSANGARLVVSQGGRNDIINVSSIDGAIADVPLR